MKGALIIAHGSRARETEQTLEQVVEKLRGLLPGLPAEIGFMEFGERTIAAGLERLMEGGVDEIAAIPYFLFEGMHIREDIPQELDRLRAAHPGVRIELGKTLGADGRLAEILADRVQECI